VEESISGMGKAHSLRAIPKQNSLKIATYKKVLWNDIMP
jgi:hypothetical protein